MTNLTRDLGSLYSEANQQPIARTTATCSNPVLSHHSFNSSPFQHGPQRFANSIACSGKWCRWRRLGFRYLNPPFRLPQHILTVLTLGVIAGLSLVGCPAAIGLSGSSAAAWAGLYNHGIAIMPKVAITVALSHLYSAYATENRRNNRTWYLAAALLAVSIIPYTLLTMRPTNDKLLSAAAGISKYGADEITHLINRWAALNLGRSLLPLASAVVGFESFRRDWF